MLPQRRLNLILSMMLHYPCRTRSRLECGLHSSEYLGRKRRVNLKKKNRESLLTCSVVPLHSAEVRGGAVLEIFRTGFVQDSVSFASCINSTFVFAGIVLFECFNPIWIDAFAHAFHSSDFRNRPPEPYTRRRTTTPLYYRVDFKINL